MSRSRAARVVAKLKQVGEIADREHEMTLNRVILSISVFSYLQVAAHYGNELVIEMLAATTHLFVLYWAMTAALFAHLVRWPAEKALRRILGMVTDFGLFSFGYYFGGEASAPLYLIYLWVILGNGFRFGVAYLLAATLIGAGAFSIVLATSRFWQDNFGLGMGLLAGLIVVPIYSATLIRKLSRAKQIAEEASQAKSLFLASVSHELRTPLNAIMGMSELLRGTRLDRGQHDMIVTIDKSAQVLLDLIDNVLNYARIEAGRMPHERSLVDLDRMLADVRRILAAQALNKNLPVRLHVAADVPAAVMGPRRHLQEVLLNLGGNAVKFTEKGAVDIVATRVGDASPPRLRFEVRDTGIGIESAARTQIFERFTQANDSIVNRFGGTGLGLAICKQLVEMYGGEIGVDSVVGEGSTFWIELELAEPEAPPMLRAPDEAWPSVNVATLDPGLAARVHAAVRREGLEIQVVAGEASRDPETITVLDAALCREGEAPAGIEQARTIVVVETTEVGTAFADRACASIARPAIETLLPRALRVAAQHRGESTAQAIAAGEPAAETPAAAASQPAPSESAPLVLVADDNRTNQSIVEKVLLTAGFRCEIAADGADALARMRQRRFDLVLMDINMPRMSGLEASRLYRSQADEGDATPIVALTADVTPETRRKCEEAGMNLCLAKPIRPSRLLEVVRGLLGNVPVAEQPDGQAEADPTAGEENRPATVVKHPKLKGGGMQGAFNPAKLKDLEALGGTGFVHEVVQTFLTDTEATLAELRAAVTEGDVAGFRDAAHALRSAAANVGADNVFKLCLSWRTISEQEMRVHGEAHLQRLAGELAAARAWVDAIGSSRSATSG